jgi:sulfoxide reductase catalytic subunit YedY
MFPMPGPRLPLPKISSSLITPESVYSSHIASHISRRKLLRIAALGAGAAALAACSPALTTPAATPSAASTPSSTSPRPTSDPAVKADEFGAPANSWDDITSYNNYYEFSTDKEAVADLAANFKIDPWTVTVGGLVDKPMTFDLDDLRRLGNEERIYRLRCVEAWSMVIPWMGFPLNRLLREVQPSSKARFVRFEAAMDAAQMPGVSSPFYSWPYIEGLRLDEAMHDLTFMVTGLYGKPLPRQNGAPLRLAVPWKYGFKSIKAIVKIDLVENQPVSLWSAAAPHEYGFYSNVNPERAHPRWSQATERRIGEFSRRATLPFNGYQDQVASLYTDMDLYANY